MVNRKFVFARTVYAQDVQGAIIQVLEDIDGRGLDRAFQIKEASSMTSTSDAARIASQLLAGEDQEVMIVMALSHKYEVIRTLEVARGTQARMILAPRDVFRGILDLPGSTYVVLAHNHLVGPPRPSVQDLDLTRRVEELATQLDLHLLDHIIITPNGEHQTIFPLERWLEGDNNKSKSEVF